ncbi:MAG: CBS domain-containing protein [Armatimonadetes bacterium]|nr:CBS domain-containing protein [Armatimonadota bacterium]NOG92437.1 CBS domain-containing protein [Armatimonadota bacterium]
MKADDYLKQVAEDLVQGKTRSVTVRALLAEFGMFRRGVNNAAIVKQALKKHKLTTEPDLLVPYIDERLHFRLLSQTPQDEPKSVVEPESAAEPTPQEPVPGGNDPTYRINKLEAANLEAAGRKLITVSPNTPVEQAVTEMLAGDFSQLPVMNGKTVKGMISWRSLGKRLALGQCCKEAQDAMDEAVIVSAETSIFQAINDIVEHEYVLVQREDKTISGIVTTSDLSVQFRVLSEPFLILAEIENHLRYLIDAKFQKADLEGARDPTDADREVSSASDLTFGEYVRLLENEAQWEKLNLKLDRAAFVEKLDAVRVIRNDVMHFDPEGIAEKDLDSLRAFVKFLQDLRRIGVF